MYVGDSKMAGPEKTRVNGWYMIQKGTNMDDPPPLGQHPGYGHEKIVRLPAEVFRIPKLKTSLITGAAEQRTDRRTTRSRDPRRGRPQLRTPRKTSQRAESSMECQVSCTNALNDVSSCQESQETNASRSACRRWTSRAS